MGASTYQMPKTGLSLIGSAFRLVGRLLHFSLALTVLLPLSAAAGGGDLSQVISASIFPAIIVLNEMAWGRAW